MIKFYLVLFDILEINNVVIDQLDQLFAKMLIKWSYLNEL